MNKEKYTNLELVILSFLIFNSHTSSFIINSFKGFNSVSIIISIIISLAISLVSLNLFFKLWNNNFLNNLSKNIVISTLFKIIFLISSFTILLYSLSNTSIILKEVLLKDSNIIVIQLSLLIVASFLSLKGFKSLSIASNLFFIIFLVVATIIFAFSITNVKEINLLPLSFNVNSLNYYELFIFSISPIFMLLLIKKELVDDFKKYKKMTLISYIIFSIYLIFKVLFIISILGDKYFNLVSYPEIEVLKMINIFNFFKNLEEMLIINVFIECLIIVSLSLSYITTVINSIYNLNKKVYFIVDVIIFIILLNFKFTDYFIYEVILTIFIIANMFTFKRKYK